MRFLPLGAFAIAALTGLTGCSSLHLYNKTSEQTAAAASQDYADSKVDDTFKQLRANADAMEAKEVTAFRQLTFAIRDSTLLRLMASPEIPTGQKTVENGFISNYTKQVSDRLTTLDGDPKDQNQKSMRAEYRDATNQLNTLIEQEQRYRAQLQNFHAAAVLPECTDPFPLSSNVSYNEFIKASGNKDPKFAKRIKFIWDGVTPILDNIVPTCQKRLKQQKKVDELSKKIDDKELDVAMKEMWRLKKNSMDDAAKAKAVKAALVSASEELAAATKKKEAQAAPTDLTCPAPKKDGEPSGDPAAPNNKVCDALARLSTLGDAGLKLLAEEKIKRIHAVLAAASGLTGKTDNPDLDQSLALLSAATRLGHALELYRNADTLPALEPLIIEKQLAEVELAQANAGLRLAKAREAQARAQVDGVTREINTLAEAYATIKGYGPEITNDAECKNTWHCDSMEALLANRIVVNGAPVYRTAYRSMVLLSESYSVGRDIQQTAKVRLAAIDYQESLIRSESAAAAWRAIIDTPIAQLKAYHEGGLKPESVIALLQALGVIGIAVK